ncbi:MAG TPA: cytochrome c-type biogenesis CcmF C-terminal domain-containing protein, partial [Thermoanaerobaculia bacterium]|nr:cytochrome c-type biogenesis CcmF C-terminal domain-containing protein [Thermoanaerobaculia bacterium]
FILGIAVLCALGFVILLGTSAPLVTRLTGTPSQVQTPFYTRTTIPGAFLLAILAGLVPFVSWKGEPLSKLASNSLRSAVVGAVGIAVALAVGAREPVSLAILFLALFLADMNLRAVLRKAKNGKFGGAGGYLAHVGLGIMLAGIVLSGEYAVSKRLTLPVNRPVEVSGSKLTFLRVIPGSATRKQAMEVRVETPNKKTYYAYPKMYVNSKTNQLMANPAIRNSALFDFYIAPQSYDPGQAEQVGRDVKLQKGTTTNIDGTGFTFREFNADVAGMTEGTKTVSVKTNVTVTPPDGSQHDATLNFVYHLDGSGSEADDVDVPGVPGGKMRVMAVSPKDEAVVLRMVGVSKDKSSEYQAATTESLSVDVTRKPMIAFVWGGFYVMMAGGVLAFAKRAREARHAMLAAEAEPSAPPRESVPATGPAVPVHTRSRV